MRGFILGLSFSIATIVSGMRSHLSGGRFARISGGFATIIFPVVQADWNRAEEYVDTGAAGEPGALARLMRDVQQFVAAEPEYVGHANSLPERRVKYLALEVGHVADLEHVHVGLDRHLGGADGKLRGHVLSMAVFMPNAPSHSRNRLRQGGSGSQAAK